MEMKKIVLIALIALLGGLIVGVGIVTAEEEEISGERIIQDANYLQRVILAADGLPCPDKEKLQSIEPAMSELDQILGELKKTKENLTVVSSVLSGYIESKTGLKSEEMTGDLRTKISAGIFSTSQEIEASVKQERFPERIWGNFTIYYEDSEIQRLKQEIQPLITSEIKLPGRKAAEVIFANIGEKHEVSVLDILALDSAVNQWKREVESAIAKIEETEVMYLVRIEKVRHPFLQKEFAGVEVANGFISLAVAIIVGYAVFYRTKNEDKGIDAGVITFVVTLIGLTIGVAVVMLY